MLKKSSSIGGVGFGVVGVKSSNLDAIRCGDWIIDLGPDDGDKSGEIVVV